MEQEFQNKPKAEVETGEELIKPDLSEAGDLMEAKPPRKATPQEIQQTEQEADQLVEVLLKNPDDRSKMREATSIGDNIQIRANNEFKLLRTSLGKTMDQLKKTGETTTIPNDLKRLRDIMDEMNPYPAIEQMKRSRTAGWFSRLISRIPGIGKILSDIAKRYESVQTQVDVIIQSLENGSDKLLENTLEIEERYKALKNMQRQVQMSAYKLQLVLNRIETEEEKTEDAMLKQALHKAKVRIMRRLQNLKVTENAFAQFFITMNVTMDNHESLRDAIRSMIDLTRPVLENGLALKIAQQDEKKIAEALEETQDYLGNLMVAVAQDSMDNAAEIAKVANKPLAKFEDLVKSYQILITRMDEAQKIEEQMIEAARKNVEEISAMSAQLEDRADAQELGRDTVRNIED